MKRQGTEIFGDLGNMTYEARLEALGLFSLEKRSPVW